METWELSESLKEKSFGPLWKYVENEMITDIDYNCGNLWIKTVSETKKRVEDPEITKEFMENFAVRIGNNESRSFNQVNNTLCAETSTTRITCVHESLCRSGININIRKSLPKLRFSYEQAIAEGYAERDTMNMLINCVSAKQNFVFCGEPGKGKTECGKFLSSYIKDYEHVITIEDVREWHYKAINPNKSCSELKITNSNDYEKVLSTALRMNPNWIMLAETRSREVRYLLECWSNGVSTMTTLHTDDARNIPDRILNMLENRQDANRIVNQIFNNVGIAVLLNEVEVGEGKIKRMIEQVCFYWRENGKNGTALVVEEGVLYKDRLPDFVKKKIERKIKRGIFDNYSF